MTVRLSADLANSGAAKNAISAKVGRIVREEAEEFGRRMVERANELMNQKYDMNRPFNRRRSPGTRRAATALDYRVTGNELPITVEYRVLGGEEVKLRIAGLNYGVPAHTISPSGAWELGGGARRTAAAPSSARRNPRFLVLGHLAWPEPTAPGGWRVVNGSVYWRPGANAGGGRFLQQAVEEAIAEL